MSSLATHMGEGREFGSRRLTHGRRREHAQVKGVYGRRKKQTNSLKVAVQDLKWFKT
jgi:hypothetical protein